MITYETLRKIQTQEKSSSKLVKLPENFFRDVKNYLERKEKLSKEKGNYLELQSANRILEEIFELREKKILNLAFYNIKGLKPENLTPEEKE